MKKVLSTCLMVAGLALAGLGAVAVDRALEGRHEIESALTARQLTTPAGASIPNARVDDAATARSMADWISATMDEATGGRAFNEVGRYLTAAGTDTDDVTKAALDPGGDPTVNPLRQVAFEASTGTTSLSLAVLAFKVGDIAVALGAVIAVVGLALAVTGGALAGIRFPVPAKGRARVPHARPTHA